MKRILSTFLLSIALLFPGNSGATINWANNATSLIADSGGIGSGATSVTVTTGEGDKFPAVASPHYFMITFVDVSANREIVKVTARTAGSNTMTIVRGQEGTSPRAFAEGSFVDQRITAGSLDVFSHTASAFENYYVCDASATDQADTVNDNSLASLTGDIGTTLNATIILPHSGTGSTTAYNVLQALDLSTYTNITFIAERGSIITHAANNIEIPFPKAGLYKIFSGTGTVTLWTPGASDVIIPPQWWGALGDGSNDDTTSIQAANDAVEVSGGGTVYFSATSASYKTTSDLTIDSNNVVWKGAGNSSKITLATGKSIKVSSNNITFDSLWIAGPNGGSYDVDSNGIKIGESVGTSDTTIKANILIRNMKITDMDGYGILANHPENMVVENCEIEDFYYMGIAIISGNNVRVVNNYVKNNRGTVSNNAYGISFTRDTAFNLTNSPATSNFVCSYNIVEDVTDWDGIDTHAGIYGVISNNIIKNCLTGITIDPDGDTPENAPHYIKVSDNIIELISTVDQTSQVGIGLVGSNTTDKAVGLSCTDNIIRYGGDKTNNLSGSIYTRDTLGLKISDNFVYQSGNTGVLIYHDNLNFIVSGNIIIDMKDDDSVFSAIYIRSNNNVGLIDGNMVGWSTTAGWQPKFVVKGGVGTGNKIRLGENYWDNLVDDNIPYSQISILQAITNHKVIEAHTGDATLTADASQTLNSNFGAGGTVTLTLPQTADAGLVFEFVVLTVQQLRIDPGAAGAIYINGAKQNDDKYIWADDEGESVRLVSLGNGDWSAMFTQGTWGVEV